MVNFLFFHDSKQKIFKNIEFQNPKFQNYMKFPPPFRIHKKIKYSKIIKNPIKWETHKSLENKPLTAPS